MSEQHNENSKEYVIKETRSLWKEVYDWVDCAVVTIVCVILLFTFVFRQVQIDGSSMSNTLEHGDRVIISDVFYTPKRGDVVVVSSEIYDNVPKIKRVIATEGQWVNITGGKVYVGESTDAMELLYESYIGGMQTDELVAGGFYGTQKYPLQVPEGKVFLLGDNRAVSLDSRTTAIGLVDERYIVGKAIFRVYPFDKIGSIFGD